MRFQSACASNVRGRSSGSTAGPSLASSSIFTKPPSGKRAMQYSVSLPRMRSSVGPNPIEKVRTLTPKILAKAKCPSSWTKMSVLMSSVK